MIDWKTSLSGLPLTFILLTIAGYASQQSSSHRQQANKQRQFSLEMQAIDPYLENLGEEERKKIKIELANKYFGQIPETQTSKDTEGLPLLSIGQIEKLLKSLTSK